MGVCAGPAPRRKRRARGAPGTAQRRAAPLNTLPARVQVTALVQQGASVNACDKAGRRPAHYAAAHGHAGVHGGRGSSKAAMHHTTPLLHVLQPLPPPLLLAPCADVLQFLGTHGADFDADDAQGRVPLHYAALGAWRAHRAQRSGSAVQRGRCPTAPGTWPALPPHLICACAAAGGHTRAVQWLTQAPGRCWVGAHDGSDCTALHLAARGFAASAAATAAAAAAAAGSSSEAGALPGEGGVGGSVAGADMVAQQQRDSGARGGRGGRGVGRVASAAHARTAAHACVRARRRRRPRPGGRGRVP